MKLFRRTSHHGLHCDEIVDESAKIDSAGSEMEKPRVHRQEQIRNQLCRRGISSESCVQFYEEETPGKSADS